MKQRACMLYINRIYCFSLPANPTLDGCLKSEFYERVIGWNYIYDSKKSYMTMAANYKQLWPGLSKVGYVGANIIETYLFITISSYNTWGFLHLPSECGKCDTSQTSASLWDPTTIGNWKQQHIQLKRKSGKRCKTDNDQSKSEGKILESWKGKWKSG